MPLYLRLLITLNVYNSALPAILVETSSSLRAQSAAVTLRIWHHLADDDARLLLFEPFRANDRPLPLIEAILATAAGSATPLSLRLDASQIRSGQAALGDALGQALVDIFGRAAEAAMIPAWRQVLDHLLDRIAARLEHHSP